MRDGLLGVLVLRMENGVEFLNVCSQEDYGDEVLCMEKKMERVGRWLYMDGSSSDERSK